jgi:hypothetical protein
VIDREVRRNNKRREFTWMDRMHRMKSLKLISREDARTAKRVKILTRKDFAGFFFVRRIPICV